MTVDWTWGLLDRRSRGFANQGGSVLQLPVVEFSLHGEQERVRIEEDLQLADLQLVIDGDAAEAEHLDNFALTLSAFKAADKLAEVPPGEDDVGRTTQDFKELPGKTLGEGSSEKVVRLLEVIV